MPTQISGSKIATYLSARVFDGVRYMHPDDADRYKVRLRKHLSRKLVKNAPKRELEHA
jgi:hypothetical protein